MKRWGWIFWMGCAGAAVLPAAEGTSGLVLSLPTENRALVEGDMAAYYQPTISGRLKSGMYGFVRSTEPEPPKYFDRFHEGIDVRPVHRDRNGEPLDLVLASAPGRVVYVNRRSSLSNYGLYIVLEHWNPEGVFQTLYGHLADVRVSQGERVERGHVLGRLGYTGVGINKERAHLHFEVTMMINRHFAEWFQKRGKKRPDDPNHHGTYNGNNLNGLDPARLLQAGSRGLPVDLRAVLAGEERVMKVRVPAGRDYFDWQKRFPWTVEGGIDGPLPAAWEITANRIGTPLHFRRLDTPVEGIVLAWFDLARNRQDSFTRGITVRRGNAVELTPDGRRWFDSLCYLP
jgi:hypothetical protein